MSATTFEERTFGFSKSILLFLRKYELGVIYKPIVFQLLRSATSIGANVIEGRSGNSKKNLVNYFSVALRSANETCYWLRLIKETVGEIEDDINMLMNECREISKILAKSIITMKSNMD